MATDDDHDLRSNPRPAPALPLHSIDPSPFRERDLDPDCEEFIVSWAREMEPDRAKAARRPNGPSSAASTPAWTRCGPPSFACVGASFRSRNASRWHRVLTCLARGRGVLLVLGVLFCGRWLRDVPKLRHVRLLSTFASSNARRSGSLNRSVSTVSSAATISMATSPRSVSSRRMLRGDRIE